MDRLALALLFVAAFATRLLLFTSSAEPAGTDGYYYLVQIEHLLATGRLHAPDGSWVLWFLAGVARALGSPLAGMRVGTALLAAACVPSAWFAGHSLGRWRGEDDAGRRSLAWLLALWAAGSPALTHLAGDFPKNLGAVAPLLLALGFAVRPGSGRDRLGLAASLLLAAGAHRLGAALAAVAAAGCGLGLLAARGRDPRRIRRVMAVVCAAGALFVVASALLPNLLHPLDLQRIPGQLELGLHLPPPFSYFTLRHTHPAEKVELVLPWAALLLGLLALVRRHGRAPLLAGLLAPLALCLFPLWRSNVLDLGYRLALMAPVVAAPLAAATLPGGMLRPWPAAPRLAAVGLAALCAWTGFDPAETPPYPRYRALIARIPRPLPELLIAHQGINFLYDHLTGQDAMAWAPEPELDRARIGRVVWGVRPGEWMTFGMGPGRPPPLPLDSEYSYVREDVWEDFLVRARAEGDDGLQDRLADWRNPTAIRPASLLRNRRTATRRDR